MKLKDKKTEEKVNTSVKEDNFSNNKNDNWELIIVDDFSADNSTKIIQKIEEKDKRIKLIKNNKNMGTLYSRYVGELKANAEYIIFVDYDDLVLQDGIFNSYKFIKKNNIDIIQFHTVWHYENQTYINNNGYNYTERHYSNKNKIN